MQAKGENNMNNNFSIDRNLRVLVVDDNHAIHNDFRKILCPALVHENALEDAAALLFDNAPGGSPKRLAFEIDSAFQGQEALALVQKAIQDGRPYAIAFLDVRMPPGWDGVETAVRLWEVCPDLQIVICTAYADYSWDEMTTKLGNSDQLVVLKKPFDTVEVMQLSNALTEKWRLHQEVKLKLNHLEKLVQERTQVLRKTNEKLQAEIIERQRAAEALREQAMLLDLAHDAIFVRDLEGRIHYWNKSAARLYGWTAEEAVGNHVAQVFSHDNPTPYAAAEKVLFEKDEWSGELPKHTREGKEVIVDSRWTLLRNESGSPRSVLMIDTDVTEKKKLEAQFLRAQRMEGIGTLATGMAHDLNNILAPILISAGTMRLDLAPNDREAAISRIEMSIKRAAEIIRQVLTFGRGVSGERVAVNPAELMEEVSKITGQTFPKDITITVDAGTDLWPIIGDKTQIHQVLLNLCINARDAMPKGGALSLLARNFTVAEDYAVLHPPLQAGPYVMLQVKDNGEGISPANIEKIFDPFFTTKKLGKGTGLGLSTVLGIVKSHHGLVTVDTELNKGTSFQVLLPASPVVAKRSAPENAAPLPSGHGEVIMIVDDEVAIVSATKKMLEMHGYRVEVASNGREALSIYARNNRAIDLVLTDIMMPVMDGTALVQVLKGINPQVKIIASSGLGRDLGGNLRAAELEGLGVKTFLSKPYTAEKLLIALNDLLEEKQESVKEEYVSPTA